VADAVTGTDPTRPPQAVVPAAGTTASTAGLDIRENRRATKYPLSVQLARVLWALACPLFRLSPRPLFGWRRALLRLFGARVGRGVHVYPSTVIYMPWNLEIGEDSAIGEWALVYNLGPVRIGSRATVSHRAHLCAGTHDHTDPALSLLRPPIAVGDQAWVCADAYLGPGVSVGEGAVVGARAVVVRDVAPWAIVAGNPARVIGQRVLRNAHGGR
jgi:putative colanic acid biosynthesis acetyltransferase WcaF